MQIWYLCKEMDYRKICRLRKDDIYEKNLTTGSVFKNLVLFSLPYFLSYFLQTLYGMADLFIIGQFEGVASTTAVSVGSQVMHMLTVMIVGLAMGTTVSALGAQNIGADKPERARLTLRYAILLAAGFGLVVSVLIQFSAEPIVALFTDREAAGGTEVIRLGGKRKL